MPILLNSASRILCYGMDSQEALYQMQQALAYGSNIVGGVVRTKGGQDILDRPIFETVLEAKKKTHCDTCMLFVTKEKALDALIEIEEAQIRLVICPIKDIPAHDVAEALRVFRKSSSSILLGPGSPGIITPGESKAGLMPAYIFKKGLCGIVSNSQTLMYEIALQTSRANLGQSSCVGIGSGPMFGTPLIDILELFNRDPFTEVIIVIGAHEGLLSFLKKPLLKPTLVYLSSADKESIELKKELAKTKVLVVQDPTHIANMALKALQTWEAEKTAEISKPFKKPSSSIQYLE